MDYMEKLTEETHERISAIKKKMDDEDDNKQEGTLDGEEELTGDKGIKQLVYMIDKLNKKLDHVDNKVDEKPEVLTH